MKFRNLSRGQSTFIFLLETSYNKIKINSHYDAQFRYLSRAQIDIKVSIRNIVYKIIQLFLVDSHRDTHYRNLFRAVLFPVTACGPI